MTNFRWNRFLGSLWLFEMWIVFSLLPRATEGSREMTGRNAFQRVRDLSLGVLKWGDGVHQMGSKELVVDRKRGRWGLVVFSD